MKTDPLSRFPALVAVCAIAIISAACAGAPRKPAPLTARCNEQPQWTTKNEKGQDIGIYVCFGEESKLLYAVRVLPPAPPKPAPAPKAAVRKVASYPKEMLKETITKFPKAPDVKKPEAAPAAPLATLGGTAK